MEKGPFVDDRKTVSKPEAVLERLLEVLVVGEIVTEGAMLVSLRDSSVGNQAVAGAAADAVAPRDARDTVNVDRLPSGVVAELARHGAIVSLAY